jgi:foldase protein PrsA
MDNLASQKMNLDDFCRRRAGNMLESRQFAIDTWVEQKIKKDVKVSEQDIKDYYDKAADVVSASQILIKPRGNSPEAKKEAKKKAEQMLARIRNGEDFRKLAATESNCGSNANGLAGSIGEFARGQMVQEFEDAAFALPEGGLSDVVETQFGYHIIRIDKKSKRPLPPIEQIKGKIAEDLKNIKAQDIVIGKLNEAKKQWKITISKPLKMTDK